MRSMLPGWPFPSTDQMDCHLMNTTPRLISSLVANAALTEAQVSPAPITEFVKDLEDKRLEAVIQP